MTNTVYFELEILLANGLTNADLEKVFVTFNYYELLENNQTVRTNSMSLFSMFESGTQLGDNLRFESTKGGQYQILLDYGLEYNNFTYNIVAYGNTSGYVEVDPNDPSQVYITSHIIPRTYYLRITISKNTNIPWGQNETTEFQLTP